MVELSKIVTIIFIVYIVGIALLGVYNTFYRKIPSAADAGVQESLYDGATYWGPSESLPGASCLTYSFQGSMSTSNPICDHYKGIPGQITLNTSVLDSLIPSTSRSCVDIDQLVAIKQTRTCEASPANPNPSNPLNSCVKQDGTLARIGEKEVLYSTYPCKSNVPCLGTLSLYAVGYSTTPDIPVCNGQFPGIVCLTLSGPNPNSINADFCALDKPNELFRVIRTYPGVPLNSPTNQNGRLGPIAQIVHRDTNRCLIPASDNIQLITGSCSSGAVWFLQPALTGSTKYSPQQTIYIGSLTKIQIEELYKSNNPDDIIDKLSSYGVKSIQQIVDGTVFLEPYYSRLKTDTPNEENERRATSQIVDYTLYNNILFTDTVYSF